MPPHPTEPDFPSLGDDLLQLLFALWNLVSDICEALWFLVSQFVWALSTCLEALWTLLCDVCVFVWDALSQAASTVWTFFVETFWNEFVGAMTGLADYVVAHPATATVIFVLAFVFVPRALDALGASLLGHMDVARPGALRASYAPDYQSTSHGRNPPRGPTKGGFRVVGGSL